MKDQTTLYDSSISWKKAVSLHTSLTTNFIGNTTSVQDVVKKYFSEFVDILKAQSQEKHRNVLRYVADIASKLMPPRTLDQKGLSRKYPDLFVQAFMLTFPSTDAVPQIIMTDSQLQHLNDTHTYLSSLPGDAQGVGEPAAKVPPKKKRKVKSDKEVSDAAAGAKTGINRLDMIELAVQDVTTTILKAELPLKTDVIEMLRRRCLEFCFRSGKMEVAGGAHRTKPKTLKCLEECISHFKQLALDMHTLTADFNIVEARELHNIP